MIEIDNLDADKSAESQLADAFDERDNEIRFLHQDLVAITFLAATGISVAGLLTVALLATAQSVLGLNLPGIMGLVQWIGSGAMGVLLAFVFAAIAVASFVILRKRLLDAPSFYIDAGCPQCLENDLLRVRRLQIDRGIAAMGIPVRRYACRNCSFEGLRLAVPLPVIDNEHGVSPEDALMNNESEIQSEEAMVGEGV